MKINEAIPKGNIAFWVQYQANEQQRRDIRLERFETNFFEFLRLHKDNINELRINGNSHGRDSFVDLYNELRLCFYLVKYFVEKSSKDTADLGFQRDDEEAKLKLAYIIFFIGIGDKSQRLWFEEVRGLCPLGLVAENLYEFVKSQQPKDDIAYFKYRFDNGDVFEYTTKYRPFVGHLAHLGHYYRHLYQTVRYVDEGEGFDRDKKYQYVKMLRAQLSAYEQILLYYNTFSRFGASWLSQPDPFLIRYRMIKNIPLPLADFGVKPEEKFHDEVQKTRDLEDKFFEWHEV